MFSSIKIGLVLFMLLGAGGGFLYVKKLQKDNETLKLNQVKLEEAIQDSNEVIEQQQKDFKKIRNTITNLENENAKLKKDKDIVGIRVVQP